MKKAIAFLRKRADEFEATGVGQYKSSAKPSIGYTTFSNARHWGHKARLYREAANELEKEMKK